MANGKKRTVLHAVETEVDPAAAMAKIAPITVGNPLDITGLAIDQAHLEELADPDAKSSVVECRRPPKGLYFAVRPEKWWITKSMILGWITRRQYLEHHEPARWRVGGGTSTSAKPAGQA